MRVVRKGVDPLLTERLIECDHCKSLLGVFFGDGKYTADQRDGDFLTFTCLICKHTKTISVKSFFQSPLASPAPEGKD